MRPLLALLAVAGPLLAAPVPPEPKPKPRAKLLGTLTVRAEVLAAHWTPDGKHLVLVTDARILVYPREAVGKEKPTPVTAFDRPATNGEVGLTPSGGVWALAPAGRKVNAENRLLMWEAKTLLAGGEPKPDRETILDVDNPYGLVWAADERTVYATLLTTRPVGNPNRGWDGNQDVEYLPRFLRLDARTGDVAKNVPLADLTVQPFAGGTTDPRTGRLYLATVDGEETVVQCREPDGGKEVWQKRLPGKAAPHGVGVFTLTPDGEHLAFVQPVLTVDQPPAVGGGGGNPFAPGGRPGGGRPPAVSFSSASAVVLLSAKTGELGPEVSKGTFRNAQVHSFSADGRLLFAGVEGSRLTVWDTRTGTEVKGWDRGHADVSAAFAPAGYELAIVERERKDIYGPSVAVPSGVGRDGQQQWGTRQEVVRTEYTSTVGVWDLAPVVK